MALLGFFNAADVEKLGAELAQLFIDQIPPAMVAKKDKSISRKKEVLRKITYKIDQFKRENKLNVYKKAKLGNAFQWALKDAGYDPAFVSELTKEILLKV
jgi:hypothetical protein